MKKAFLALAVAALLLCTACGGPKITVDGTWYSITDATMYNFADGEITVSGLTVGQYEDNGDSVVLSLMDTGENLQLYVTSISDIVVLADVREGEGTTYFCKGLENARSFMADALLYEFATYIEENIFGVWTCPKLNSISSIVFSGDAIKITAANGNVISYHVIEINAASDDAGAPYAEIALSDSGVLTITPRDEDYWITDDLIINTTDVIPAFHNCWITKD